MNPLRAVGQLLHWEPSRRIGPTFLGTCFAYRSAGLFLTAAHCLGDLKNDQLAVMTPRGGLIKSALGIDRHPSADIAKVRTASIHTEGDEVEPFEIIVGNWRLGEDFFAYGYASDVLGEQPDKPTERLFKGHFQRFLEHRSRVSGSGYVAGELSIPVPAGLSGGPLFRPAAPSVVTAIATENLSSTTYLEHVESVTNASGKVEKHYERVIEYGVALMLSPLQEWLDRPGDQRS